MLVCGVCACVSACVCVCVHVCVSVCVHACVIDTRQTMAICTTYDYYTYVCYRYALIMLCSHVYNTLCTIYNTLYMYAFCAHSTTVRGFH